MQEIEFYFDWDGNKVIFNDGMICDMDFEIESFFYKDKKFFLESDVEKDLCYTFNMRYVNMTEY
ncbi:hypothetical protein [Cetobacterium sp.]|uniref:hypothetical protein n=1 Tax=Cetobacterium sp. TaxID=2071632 RepID=UPI003F2E876B